MMYGEKLKKNFVSPKNVRTFAPAFERGSMSEKTFWSGSSVWLEYMPVTHGVASSSLVRTAKQILENSTLTSAVFCERGLLGFDSRDNGFVSMQADAPEALKTDAEQ